MTVIPEICERFRGSVSLGLDGMLSTFETRLLERHLETCADCREFAAAVGEQTAQLRTATLEAAPRIAATVATPARRTGRPAALAAAGAAAVVAAMLSFVSTGGGHNSSVETAGTKSALLAVVPSQPTANPNIEVPRVEVVSPASADGPVRGYYGVPA